MLICVLYILYLLLGSTPAQAILKYMVINAAVFIIISITYFQLKTHPLSPFFPGLIIIFSFLFGLTLLWSQPDQSDDIYRYLWDGKLQYHHISPYQYAPNDPLLTLYHSPQLPRLVNFPHLKTIYPPVAQLFFRLSFTLFGESSAGMKFLFLLVLVGCNLLFYLILKHRGGDIRLLLLFAWNPLVVMETTINGHLDILLVFFVLLFLYFFYKQRLVWSGTALGLSILTKLIPMILVPLVFLYILKKKEFTTKKMKGIEIIKFFGPLLVTMAGFYLLYFDSLQNLFFSALTYSTRWFFNNPLFTVLLEIVRDNRIAHIISFSLFILIYLVILVKKLPLEQQIFYTIFAFIFMNPTIHPWYLILLLSMLCIYHRHWVILWSGLIVVAYMVVYQYKLTGVWHDSWIILTIEYLPLLVAIGWEYWHHGSNGNHGNYGSNGIQIPSLS